MTVTKSALIFPSAFLPPLSATILTIAETNLTNLPTAVSSFNSISSITHKRDEMKKLSGIK
jgi:hypothetical protein